MRKIWDIKPNKDDTQKFSWLWNAGESPHNFIHLSVSFDVPLTINLPHPILLAVTVPHYPTFSKLLFYFNYSDRSMPILLCFALFMTFFHFGTNCKDVKQNIFKKKHMQHFQLCFKANEELKAEERSIEFVYLNNMSSRLKLSPQTTRHLQFLRGGQLEVVSLQLPCANCSKMANFQSSLCVFIFLSSPAVVI